MKLFSAIAAAAVIGGSCISSLPVKATIWADLNNKTVLGKNDNITDVYITFNGKTQRVKHVDAALPVDNSTALGKTQNAAMTQPGYEYYMTIFKRDVDREKAFNLGDQNQWRGGASRASGSCPSGTREYQKSALFGLIKGKTMCLSDYEAESLRSQQRQNFQNNMNQNRQRNCTTNFIGSTAYTNCY